LAEKIDIFKLKMNSVRLTTPVKSEDLKKLQLGDLVFLDGTIYTGREGLYKRLIDDGLDLPVDLSQITNVNFHCSPAASVTDDGGYVIKAVSATASFRFGKWMEAFFEKTGCQMILGKAGMTSEAYKNLFLPASAIYLTTVGYGLGATYGRTIKKVRDVYWLKELGIAQAVWVLEVENMGPFIVESDMQGNSLFELSNEHINQKVAELMKDSPKPTLRRFGEETDRQNEVV